MCQAVMSPGSRDPSIQINIVKTVGVASRITAADKQQNKHEAKVKLSVSFNPASLEHEIRSDIHQR